MHLRAAIIVAVILSGMLAPAFVLAQRGQQASLTGQVTDDTGAVLPGARVTISSPQLIGGARSHVADERGTYRFAALMPGTYLVVATHEGFATTQRASVEVGVGMEATVDMRLPVAGTEVTVDVEGVAPAVDVRSASWPATLQRPFLDHAPVPLSRSVVDLVELAPGISRGVAWGGPAFVMKLSRDGTDSNDPAIGFPDAGPRVNWTDSIQVVSVGAPAEYGEFTNARINVVTRSGSNRYSGLGEFWATGPQWTQSNREGLPQGAFRPAESLEWWNLSGQVGGPVLRDRAWFFGGADYFRQSYRSFGYTGPRPAGRAALRTKRASVVAEALDGAGVRPSRRRVRRAPRRLDAQRERRAQRCAGGPLEYPVPAGLLQPAHDVADGRAHTARSALRRRQRAPHVGASVGRGQNGPAPHRDQATQVNSVNVQSFGETTSRVHAGRVVMTHQVEGGFGRGHELRAGLEYEHTSRIQEQRYPGDMLFLDRDGQPELVWIWPGAITRPSFDRTSLFVQDIWRLTDRVTVQPGVRMSIYRTDLPDTTMALYENEAVSPRIGVAWDVRADHRTVVRAHYGHYHEGIYTALLADFDPLAQAPTITARVVGPGQYEEVSRSAVTATGIAFDPDARHMYTEEITGGVEHEWWPRWTVTMQYVRRNTRNTLGYIDTGTTWTPTEVVEPGRDGRVGTADDGGPMTLFFNRQRRPPTTW